MSSVQYGKEAEILEPTGSPEGINWMTSWTLWMIAIDLPADLWSCKTNPAYDTFALARGSKTFQTGIMGIRHVVNQVKFGASCPSVPQAHNMISTSCGNSPPTNHLARWSNNRKRLGDSIPRIPHNRAQGAKSRRVPHSTNHWARWSGNRIIVDHWTAQTLSNCTWACGT